MAVTQQSIAYHVRIFAGSKHRQVGTVFVAGADAPIQVRGHLIYYRLLNSDYDLWMNRDMTTGFSLAVFERVKSDGVDYVAAHSKETGKMLITHVSRFNKVINYGQGVQVRANVDDSAILENVRRLMFPTAISTVEIKDEEPISAPSLPVESKPKVKGMTTRCGCYYENGTISKSCLDHASQWASVLKS